MNTTGMDNIAVIGSGTMGNGIAHIFAQTNHKVALIDISEKALIRGIETINRNLDRQVTKGTIDEDTKAKTIGNIRTTTSIQDGVSDADLVIEAATEQLELKLSIFKEMDSHAPPSAILATNTSSISITRIASITNRPEKVIGMHFMNPVPMMKLVEIIRGLATSEETFEATKDLALH